MRGSLFNLPKKERMMAKFYRNCKKLLKKTFFCGTMNITKSYEKRDYGK